jgi:tetratricopeptide (TPR) repeat protein
MKGRVDESIQTNLKVIEQEPDCAVAYNNLAIAYLEKGDTEAATSHLQKAEALGYAVDPELKAEIEKQQ